MMLLFYWCGSLFLFLVLYVFLLFQYCGFLCRFWNSITTICSFFLEKSIYYFHILRIYYNVWLEPVLHIIYGLLCFYLQRQLHYIPEYRTHINTLLSIGAPSVTESYSLLKDLRYTAYSGTKQHPVESAFFILWEYLAPVFAPLKWILAPAFSTFHFIFPLGYDNFWFLTCGWWLGYLTPIFNSLHISMDYLPKSIIWGTRPPIANPYTGETVTWLEFYSFFSLLSMPLQTISFELPELAICAEDHVRYIRGMPISISSLFSTETHPPIIDQLLSEAGFSDCLTNMEVAAHSGADIPTLQAYKNCEHLFVSWHLSGTPIARIPAITGGYVLYWQVFRKNIHPVMWAILNIPATGQDLFLSFMQECGALLSYWGSLFFSFTNDVLEPEYSKWENLLLEEQSLIPPRIYVPHVQLRFLAAQLFEEYEYASFSYKVRAELAEQLRIQRYIFYLSEVYGEDYVATNYSYLAEQADRIISVSNPADIEEVSLETILAEEKEKEELARLAFEHAVQDISDWMEYTKKNGLIFWSSEWSTKGMPWYVDRGARAYIPKERLHTFFNPMSSSPKK